MRLVEVDMMSK